MTTTVDWHFCPHCETQLDAVTFICPACRWDPLAPVEQADDPEAGLSLTERYRGTQYSTSSVAAAPAIVQGAPANATSRVRTFIIVGFVLLLGMYGGMLIYSDFQNRPTDRPATLLDR
ncbi:MAG: hypothetical protein ABWZ82_10545 [Candidatus Limnocylindrales bacterium]